MEYTIARLAAMAHITTRTLRHYHQLNLLTPLRISSNGYRIYGEAEITRLQQILFFRELGLPLERIKSILDDPHFDTPQALQSHLSALRERRTQLDALIRTAEKTIQSMKGEITMSDTEKFEGFKKKMIEDNEEQYGLQARERYGDDAINSSNEKLLRMTPEQYETFAALQTRLHETLKAAVESGNPKGEHGMQTAALHREWLEYTWASYSPEAHASLAQMYVEDPRFTAYYENIAPGAAEFLRDAVAHYAGQLSENQ